MKKIAWTKAEIAVFRRLSTPEKIQNFLDTLKYNVGDITRSPRFVLKTRQAHCFDGAMFAAAALEFNGEPPTVIDLRANDQDDDHILAIFRKNGLYGSIGQSNYTSCRYRDPVYKTIRELVLSYFYHYFNLAGKKTLREYSVLFDLRKIKDIEWETTGEDLSYLGERIDNARHFSLFPAKTEKILSDADDRLFQAETLGLDPAGAFKVSGSRFSARKR